MLLYGTETCPMKKLHIASLQFAVNSCFVKMFIIRSKAVFEKCQCYFNFDPVSDIIAKRTHKFSTSYDNSDSLLCSVRHAWT